MTKTLAIIGTAGRKEDASRLTVKHWNAMCHATIGLIEANTDITALVSGGAAWADHVAVRIHSHYEGRYPLSIWLPALTRDIETALYYHEKFSRTLGRDTSRELLNLQGHPTVEMTNFGGFKDRNTYVAEEAGYFLAITFGNGPHVKDGGTADTVRKMQARGIRGWHYDLNTFTLHECARLV